MLLNKERAHRIMDQHGLEALIATSAANVAYTSERSGYCTILTRDEAKGATLIIPIAGLSGMVRNPTWMPDIRTYDMYHLGVPEAGELSEEDQHLLEMRKNCPYYDYPLDGLIAALKEKGLARARIGVDETSFDFSQMDSLKDAVPRAGFLPAREIFYQIRMVKGEEELRRLRASTEINEAAAQEVIDMLAPGVIPAEATHCYREYVLSRGATPGWFGLRAGSVYAGDPNRALEKGDPWMFDCGTCYQSYYSDTGRTGCLGEPSAKQRHHYACITEGYRTAMSLIRPGVMASEIFTAAQEAVRKAGLPNYRRHLVGHSTGYENHEPPIIGTPESHAGLVDYPLEVGMFLLIEVPYYELGSPGMQLEDTILVTQDGYELVTKMTREIIKV